MHIAFEMKDSRIKGNVTGEIKDFQENAKELLVLKEIAR